MSKAHPSLSTRTDIAFWTLVKCHEARAALLAERLSEAQALAHLHALNHEDLRVIDALVEGHHRPTIRELRDAAKLYPYLAFAIVQSQLDDIRERACARLQAAQQYRDLVAQFEEPASAATLEGASR